ncbi:MAG: redox-sensing transcriptional repressor Rex [Lachnospiraceae bacterium]|nr:redox-sensing transcriptional repressor Rex [Lachnospiraceae bacterium]
MDDKNISQAVISRLPRYLRYLGELKDSNIERISSQELSELMNVTASQIRQDFNNFGGFGQQGYGYKVNYLYDEIAKILGINKTHHLIIVGAGNLGQALANYMNFERRGFHFTGIFDSNEKLYGKKIRDMYVQPMEELEHFVKENDIDIAVLTIPKGAAVKIAEQLVSYGVKAFWNFAHIDLKVPKDIVVENVHLSDSLMRLTYTITRNESEKEN